MIDVDALSGLECMTDLKTRLRLLLLLLIAISKSYGINEAKSKEAEGAGKQLVLSDIVTYNTPLNVNGLKPSTKRIELSSKVTYGEGSRQRTKINMVSIRLDSESRTLKASVKDEAFFGLLRKGRLLMPEATMSKELTFKVLPDDISVMIIGLKSRLDLDITILLNSLHNGEDLAEAGERFLEKAKNSQHLSFIFSKVLLKDKSRLSYCRLAMEDFRTEGVSDGSGMRSVSRTESMTLAWSDSDEFGDDFVPGLSLRKVEVNQNIKDRTFESATSERDSKSDCDTNLRRAGCTFL